MALLLLCSAVAPSAALAAEEGLNLLPDPMRMLLSFVVLALLIVPVQRLLLRPLTELLVQRSARTVGAIDQAEQNAAHARELDAAIGRRLSAARQQAMTERAAALARVEEIERDASERARAEAARTIEGIRASIVQETDTARAALPGLARDLAREAASKLLGRAL